MRRSSDSDLMQDGRGKRRAILQVVDRQADASCAPVTRVHTCEGRGEVEEVEQRKSQRKAPELDWAGDVHWDAALNGLLWASEASRRGGSDDTRTDGRSQPGAQRRDVRSNRR